MNRIECVWEHNGSDTILYASNFPGAYTRGADLNEALSKMQREVQAFTKWSGESEFNYPDMHIVQDYPCSLLVRDADSDVMFLSEEGIVSEGEYRKLKAMALKSALDFQMLFDSVPDKRAMLAPKRETFYGEVPASAEEMYLHTKNVNGYYFGEIGVDSDNEGAILECRQRGFDLLESRQGYLDNTVIDGSYDERWSLRKLLRRFVWHDRIHAKAMYRGAVRLFGADNIEDPFFFSDLVK